MAKEEVVEQQDVNETVEEEVSDDESESVEEEEVVEEEEHEEKIPYSRFKEKIDETNDLRGMVNTLSQLVTQNTGVKVSDIEKPEDMDERTWNQVKKLVDQNTGKNREGLEQIIGGVLEKLDETKALVSNPNIKKHINRVESLRKEYSNRGVYLTREDAYAILVGKGIIKKDASGKKIVVKKTNVKVSQESTGARGSQPETGGNKKSIDWKAASEADLDKFMEGKTF